MLPGRSWIVPMLSCMAASWTPTPSTPEKVFLASARAVDQIVVALVRDRDEEPSISGTWMPRPKCAASRSAPVSPGPVIVDAECPAALVGDRDDAWPRRDCPR